MLKLSVPLWKIIKSAGHYYNMCVYTYVHDYKLVQLSQLCMLEILMGFLLLKFGNGFGNGISKLFNIPAWLCEFAYMYVVIVYIDATF